jgi:hypothetical protein
MRVNPSVRPNPGSVRLFHHSKTAGTAKGRTLILMREEFTKEDWAPDHPIESPSRPNCLRLVNLIKHASVIEISLLSVGPSTEEIIDSKKLDVRKLLAVFLCHFRQAWPVKVLSGYFLTFRRIEILHISSCNRARPSSIDDLVESLIQLASRIIGNIQQGDWLREGDAVAKEQSGGNKERQITWRSHRTSYLTLLKK